jgi:hypothetical protein
MDQFSKLYFQNEMKMMNKGAASTKQFNYTKDFKIVKEVPDHRKREAFEKLDTKEVMFEPN